MEEWESSDKNPNSKKIFKHDKIIYYRYGYIYIYIYIYRYDEEKHIVYSDMNRYQVDLKSWKY